MSHCYYSQIGIQSWKSTYVRWKCIWQSGVLTKYYPYPTSVTEKQKTYLEKLHILLIKKYNISHKISFHEGLRKQCFHQLFSTHIQTVQLKKKTNFVNPSTQERTQNGWKCPYVLYEAASSCHPLTCWSSGGGTNPHFHFLFVVFWKCSHNMVE